MVSIGCEIFRTAKGLHTYTIDCFIVLPDTLASVADELSHLSTLWDGRCSDVPYGVNLLLALQLLCNFIRLLQIFQITLDPMHLASITVLLKLFDCFIGVLLFLGKQ